MVIIVVTCLGLGQRTLISILESVYIIQKEISLKDIFVLG